MRGPIPLLLAGMLLAGCAGPTTVSTGSPYQQIDGYYGYVAADRDLTLVVHGNPFAMPDPVFAKVVEIDAQVPLNRAPTHPTLTPGPSARPNTQLVFLFQPAHDLPASALCQGRFDQEPAPVGEVRALGAFCLSGKALTEVEGSTPDSGAGDERFLELVRQMMFVLFRPDIRESSHHGGISIP